MFNSFSAAYWFQVINIILVLAVPVVVIYVLYLLRRIARNTSSKR